MTYEAGAGASAPPTGAELAEGLPINTGASCGLATETGAAEKACPPRPVDRVTAEHPVLLRPAIGPGVELLLHLDWAPTIDQLRALVSHSDRLAVVEAGLALLSPVNGGSAGLCARLTEILRGTGALDVEMPGLEVEEVSKEVIEGLGLGAICQVGKRP